MPAFPGIAPPSFGSLSIPDTRIKFIPYKYSVPVRFMGTRSNSTVKFSVKFSLASGIK